MQIDRNTGIAPGASDIEAMLASLGGECLDCASCAGTCRELIEMLVLPGFVLKENGA